MGQVFNVSNCTGGKVPAGTSL